MEKKNFLFSMNKTIEWTFQQEQLLITWAEKASGYAWLHTHSVNYFKHRNLYISIPASLFGYLAGALTLLSEDENPILRGFIGFSGIVAGLLTNFQEIFTFKEESEKHKISSLRFLAFFREISCELSMDYEHRTPPGDYITMKRLEFDKMLEQSPNIPSRIAKQFNEKFKHVSLHKPDIVNGLQTIFPFGKQTPKMYYRKKINLYEKILLLRYFSIWNAYCEGIRLQRKKRELVEITNATESMRERDKGYAYLFGPLSTQKKMLQFQNIKIKHDPFSLV